MTALVSQFPHYMDVDRKKRLRGYLEIAYTSSKTQAETCQLDG